MSDSAQASATEVWIPWREHPSRTRALVHVTDWWENAGYPVHLIDTDHEPFNLSACRNAAVRAASTHVVILADADTFPDLASLREAVSLAEDEHGTVLPYTSYRSLRADGSRYVYAGHTAESAPHITIPDACSGIYVTTRAGWNRHHGQDELFKGWGCEDAAWWIAHETLIGQPRRVAGNVYALTHESQIKNGEPTRNNYARIYQYEQARGNKERILQLLGAAR